MNDWAYIAEDHRFATTVEVQSRSREELTYLPHIAGPDLQVLCEELAGHILSQPVGRVQILVFAPGGTALFLARYLGSFSRSIQLTVGIEDGYATPQVIAELKLLPYVTVASSMLDNVGSDDLSCIVLAPVLNLLSWLQVVHRSERAPACRVLAHDPGLVLRRVSDTGTYAYAVSKIWCGHWTAR